MGVGCGPRSVFVLLGNSESPVLLGVGGPMPKYDQAASVFLFLLSLRPSYTIVLVK